MFTVKEQMMRIIDQQPDDSSYDEILRELLFVRMIDRGLKDSSENRKISNGGMQQRIKTWKN